MDYESIAEHTKKQNDLKAQIKKLELALEKEDNETKHALKFIENDCKQAQIDIDAMEGEHKRKLQEQITERKIQAAKQQKKIEMAQKVIHELRKENKKIQKRREKRKGRLENFKANSSEVQDMNQSLSDLADDVCNDLDAHVMEQDAAQETVDDAKKFHAEIKIKIMEQQDKYWEIAQSRLEYQKTMARILNLVQNALPSHKGDKAFIKACEKMTLIALEAEAEAKVEMAQLEIETAQIDSDTTYTEVSESSNDGSNPHLEINLVNHPVPSNIY